MFDLVAGLPVHALIVHVVVVLAPLAALLAIVYAVIPRTRRALRWPIAALTLLAGPAAFIAGGSGEKLAARIGESEPLVHQHTEIGDVARIVIAAGMLFTLICVLVLVQPLRRVVVTAPGPVSADSPGATAAPPTPEAPETQEHRASNADAAIHRKGALGAFARLEQRGSALSTGPIAIVLSVLLVASSAASIYETFEAGHSGAKAVWSDQVGGHQQGGS